MTTKNLHILCFGASITAGYSSYGAHYYPYASRLAARLADGLPTTKFGVDVDGAPGDTVLHGQYMNRMTAALCRAKVPYDWVIVQAGGNDLGWDRTPTDILEAIKKVWDLALGKGAKVLALTVTEHAEASKRNLERMRELNEMILGHEQSGFFVADVGKAIPYTGMPEQEKKRIWSDGLHLTKAGYELMGDVIADEIIRVAETLPSVLQGRMKL